MSATREPPRRPASGLAGVLGAAARTLRPPAGDRHGPLAPMLVALTFVTGVVDAVSYLELGHVFVANMTGNVVFLGFAIAGASGLSTRPRSSRAITATLLGAIAGGLLALHASIPAALALGCGGDAPRLARRREAVGARVTAAGYLTVSVPSMPAARWPGTEQ